MAKKITDDEDSLKRRARRRLIGAVALTTAVVVVLPMILDSEPRPVGSDIELRIPDKDKVGEFAPSVNPHSAPEITLPASAPPITAKPDATQPVAPQTVVAALSMAIAGKASNIATSPARTDAKPETVTEIKPEAKPEDKPPVKAESTPELKAAIKPGIKAESRPETKPEAKAESKPETKPDAKPEAKPQAKAESKPETKPEARSANKDKATPHAGFVVQVGAFSKADTVHQWQKKLSKHGNKVYTEKMGDKVRVRIGPYPTREAAEKERRKIEALGAHPVIINLAQ